MCRFIREARFAPVQRDGSARRALVVEEFAFTLEPQCGGEVRRHVPPVSVEKRRRAFAAKGLAESVREQETRRHCG